MRFHAALLSLLAPACLSGQAGSLSLADATPLLDAVPPDAAPPPDLPSRQTVTFELHGAPAGDRWVIMRGLYCTGFGVGTATGQEVPLALGFQCLCECPNPGPPRGVRYHRVAAGSRYSITWDARRLVTFTTPYDCAQHGWPGLGTIQQLHGVLQPVSPGDYRLTLPVETAAPAGCTPSGDDWMCPEWPMGCGGGLCQPPPNIASLCPASTTAGASFTLPPLGDVTVPIALP